ncbi:T9SS type A sorting domain-containing protein [Chryseobacterium aahli]|uniref:T9SS type A sorting domain-containing protein n=1 Tax=Chryseobacterium aahli TaxID=1278643 RepID=UPI001F600C72|nr:T9SS type A sorting domain-containing protein [Chryseobacterium aahli]MCI3938666.1 T9SS type A sorting domain-containing protein [Chryseobacterium aahli]
MKKTYLWLLLICSFATMKAQTTYYSKASATDFTAVGSWGTATDGTGTSPTSISNADNFVIQNASVMTLPGNASVRQLTINSGSLTIAANTLTVSKAGAFDSTLNVAGGTLTVSGGNLDVNGNVVIVSGATFNQSNGTITVDGNNGGSATGSVVSGTTLFEVKSVLGTVNGGTLTIVDPPATGTGKSFGFNFTAGNVQWVGHTLRFGNGTSTDASANANGFEFDTYIGSGGTQSLTGNVIVDGGNAANRWTTSSSASANGTFVGGNLTINAGSELRNISAGGTLSVAGNITNNGTFTAITTLSLSSRNATGGAIAAPNAQTISGSGVFRNLTASPTANFTSVLINNSSVGGVTFADANSLLSGANTSTVSGTLTFTNGVVNTGVNTFVLGVSGTTLGTLSHTAGGFSSGSTFSRWYGTTGSGTTIAAATVPTSGAGTYPFVTGNAGSYNANHFHRATAALTTAGQMAVKFNAAIGTSAITPVTEGSLTYDRQTNANWVVTTSAGYASSATHTFAIQGQGTYTVPTIANITLLNNGALVGIAQAGTNQPMGQRTAVPSTNIAATYTLGSILSENPIESAQSGPWESTSTWIGGVVPSCANATILSGHTVTVSSSTTATSNNVVINSGGTLAVTGGSITVGCTNNNNTVINNGTINVSGGSVIVNGNINNVSGSTFAQSGGDIKIDGNNAGATATSVASGTNIVNIATGNVTLTGGAMTVVDPHAASSTTSYAFSYSGGTAIDNTIGWTLKFGDGSSTDAGGTTATASAVGGFIWNNAGSKIYFDNVIIDGASGTNRYVSNSSTIGINTLTINANGEFRMPTSGISIAGNFTNNGTFTHTASTLSFQNFKNNGTASASTTPQSISGTGVFRNNIVTASSTANFNSILINNSSSTGVTFADANSLLSGTNTGTASGTLTLTTGFVNTGANTFILGISAASTGTLSYAAGGFSTGSSFARWWGTATGGATITASSTTSTSSTTSGAYPFVTGISTAFVARTLYLNQTVAATTGGKIVVQYNDVAGTNAVSIVDGAYTVDTQAKSNWVVSQSGITGTSTYRMAINGQNIYTAGNGNSRITLASAPALGTHQAGTNYVNAQRTAVPLANLADTYYLGISASDIPFVSVANGDWNNPATWNKGTVPTCTDIVQVASGTIVTVNSSGNGSKNVTINSGGTLVNVSGDLTVGCTLKNNSLVNNGTLTVSGGILNVNGNVNNANGSTFNQSGGDIIVDGNDAGVVANSVASGTNIFGFGTSGTGATLNLTGGKIVIVDPHVATSAAGGTSNGHAFAYWGNGYRAGVNHTIQLGDGVSTDAGGHTSGFQYNTWPGTGYFIAGNLVINLSTGTNRFVVPPYAVGVEKDLTVTSGELRLPGSTSSKINGNIVNNGTLTSTGTLELALWGADLTSSTSSVASTNAQTISGTGVFRNLTASPTAGLTSLTINNSNAAGVTLNVPLSVSGTLTLTAGKVNTTSANLLTLGTATAAGTLSGGSATAYITGPFARTIANANTASTYIHYPVGKTAYAPVWLAPVTTSVANMKAEAFDTNSGTASAATIQNLSTKRWEAPLVSGTFSTINVRLGENAITNANFPVIAPTASGVYDSLFGTTGTYAAGTPNTTQSTTALATADYTGFLSYAEIASGLGTSEMTSNEKGIKVYPNPFADVLNISDVKNVKSISIVDLAGRVVKTIEKPSSSLQLRELNSGMYMVILNMNDGSRQTIKAIKK